MPAFRKPPRKPPKNPMLSRTGRRIQQAIPKTRTAFHKQAIQGAKTLGAITGKAIKSGREIHSQLRKISSPGIVARESVGSRFYFSRIEAEELEDFFQQYDEQFRGNPQALIEAMERANVLPEMFQELEEHMTKDEKIGLIKLLRKYFDAMRKGENAEAIQISKEARDFLSPVRIRAQI